MKNKSVIMVLIAFLSCFVCSYSQDEHIGQLKVKVNNIDTLLCDTLDGFNGPNQLLRGFQWGNNRSAAQSLYFNQNSIKLEYF